MDEIETLKEQLNEAELIIAERDDRMALVDRIADLIGLPKDQELDQVGFELWFSANKARRERNAQPLDWTGFKGVQINKEWCPNDQELIYTAIGVYEGDGDMDDDAREQIIERLLAAWRRATEPEQRLRDSTR